MMLSRRSVLAGLAGLGLSPRLAMAETTPDGFQIIRARRASAPLLGEGGARTGIWSFNEGAAPLVIRARQGVELKLRFVNELDFEIWLHWFGLRGPSDLMTFNVPAGAANAFDCVFTPPDAGTFWLGPMADVSRLRDMGLYAMVIVEERAPVAGIDDLPLVLDDWMLGEDGAIEAGFGDVEAMVGEGRLGNWFTVNGQYRPRLKLAAGRYARARLLNAANVRVMGLLFKGGDPLLLALDGQPVMPQPLGSGALRLAPGQRVDLLLAPDADITLALDLFEDVAEIAYFIREGEAAALPLAENFALAANPISAAPEPSAARVVPLVIEGGIKGGLKSATFRGQQLDMRALLEAGMGWAFNGMAGPGGAPLFTAKAGEAILLEVDNRTAFDQALHLHGHVWRVVREEGDAPWRDTAVVPARQKLRLLMAADNPGSWAINSLVAERADGGLLAAFSVE